MLRVNDNFQKLPGSYLFAAVARRVKVYQEAHPEREISRLGIVDVTKPLVPAVIEAMHRAVEEMGCLLYTSAPPRQAGAHRCRARR